MGGGEECCRGFLGCPGKQRWSHGVAAAKGWAGSRWKKQGKTSPSKVYPLKQVMRGIKGKPGGLMLSWDQAWSPPREKLLLHSMCPCSSCGKDSAAKGEAPADSF